VIDGFDMESAPRDGRAIRVVLADGTEDVVRWATDRYCMLGAPHGSYGDGWVDTYNGLPVMDDLTPTRWWPEIDES
jgi:hypothetical protein